MQVYRKRITERLNKVSPKHDQQSSTRRTPCIIIIITSLR